MDDEMPTAQQFASAIAELHKKSFSPKGKFGFHCVTHMGTHPLDNSWTDSWEELFTHQFRKMVKLEREIQDEDEEMDTLMEALFEKVTPRLLRVLQTGGRSIKPTLCHGDLWHGNDGLDVETDEAVLFDPCCIYAHNEFEMHPWRAARYRTTRYHQTAYHKLMEIVDPKEDYDDRNALYALRDDVSVSSQWPETKSTRNLDIEGARRLVAKYPEGFEGYKD